MTTKRLYIPESERLYEIIGRQQDEIERLKAEIDKTNTPKKRQSEFKFIGLLFEINE